MTIHFVYPFDETRISTPWAIGNHVANGLRKRGARVKQYDWLDMGTIYPQDGDILLGHPCEHPGHIVTNSLGGEWAKKYIIHPVTMTDTWRSAVELLITHKHITGAFFFGGEYWFERLPHGIQEKSRRLDLGISIHDFPLIKKCFHPQEWRKVLYIGHRHPFKNPEYLDQLIRETPTIKWGHIGADNFRGAENHGYLDLSTVEARNIIADYDFMITVGSYDANPTTMLEAMAWGLIPVATPTSGWPFPPVIQFPLNDISAAALKLRELQVLPEKNLLDIQKSNRRAAETIYHWDAVCDTIWSEIRR